MRRLLIVVSIFVSIAAFRYAWCADNLLAVDVIDNKQKASPQPEKTLSQQESASTAQGISEQEQPADPELEKIKAYHELFDNKQKELELIRLDLEKSNLLLKKKEAEKEIYQIEKVLPQGKKEEVPGFAQGMKEPLVDASDIKIQLLLISDDLKEAQASLKGVNYSFKQGDIIASRLTAEKIDSTGVIFKQQDGSILKLNFIN
jgi:hypothetical protein